MSVNSNFFFKNGCLHKSRNQLSFIFKNLNYFFYFNNLSTNNQFNNIKWLLDIFIDKNLNSFSVFNFLIDLIKPPFVIKSISIPKKLRKKLKRKFLISIVYKNESKRTKSSLKQLYYYSNQFTDSNFKVRLYKSILTSFCDYKNGDLFKLKLAIFKKFFKF